MFAFYVSNINYEVATSIFDSVQDFVVIPLQNPESISQNEDKSGSFVINIENKEMTPRYLISDFAVGRRVLAVVPVCKLFEIGL